MSKKEKCLIITNIITGILMLVFGGFCIYQMNDDAPTKCEKETNKSSSINLGSIVYAVDNNTYLEITEKKELKLVSTELGDSVIAKNVIITYDVRAGMSDICEGNRWIISENEDGEFVALSIDSLSCGNEVKTINLTNEFKNKNISNVGFIYQEEKFVHMYEPNDFKVFALSEDGKSVEITDILDK